MCEIAEHLKSSARHLYLFQYLGLDLIAFPTLVAFGIYKVLWNISKRMKIILKNIVKLKRDWQT